MSETIVGVIGISLLIVLVLFRVNIGFALAFVGFIGFAILGGLEGATYKLSLIPYHTVSQYPLAVLPLFLLMGVFASKARISDDLFDATYKWIGSFRGGLASATVLACCGFSAICGSSIACGAAMGKVAVPAMKKYKYDEKLSAGCIAAGGTMGILIPPSLGFIIYSMMTEESVGRLFMAGIFPGLLCAVFYIAVIYIICTRRPEMGPPGPRFTIKEKIFASGATWSMGALFLLVIGGIYAGIFTPSEAAAIGAFGTFALGFVMRRINVESITDACIEVIQTSAMIFLLIIGATMFMNFIAISNLSYMLADYMASLTVNRYIILGGILFVYLVIGCFMDIISAQVLTLPILFPMITALGFDPIWYGVIMVRVMEIGLITPPVGLSCYVLSSATGLPIKSVFQGIVPFVVGDIFHILLLIIFPQISLLLPNMMIG
jgi:tripartite ATP-independent transporter DctM subunit